MITEQLDEHRDRCDACRSGQACREADELIKLLVSRFGLPGDDDIDGLAHHEATCTECMPHLLCPVGERIAVDRAISGKRKGHA